MTSEIIIVSGLPRPGASLAMQMLSTAGFKVLRDRKRVAGADIERVDHFGVGVLWTGYALMARSLRAR